MCHPLTRKEGSKALCLRPPLIMALHCFPLPPPKCPPTTRRSPWLRVKGIPCCTENNDIKVCTDYADRLLSINKKKMKNKSQWNYCTAKWTKAESEVGMNKKVEGIRVHPMRLNWWRCATDFLFLFCHCSTKTNLPHTPTHTWRARKTFFNSPETKTGVANKHFPSLSVFNKAANGPPKLACFPYSICRKLSPLS